MKRSWRRVRLISAAVVMLPLFQNCGAFHGPSASDSTFAAQSVCSTIVPPAAAPSADTETARLADRTQQQLVRKLDADEPSTARFQESLETSPGRISCVTVLAPRPSAFSSDIPCPSSPDVDATPLFETAIADLIQKRTSAKSNAGIEVRFANSCHYWFHGDQNPDKDAHIELTDVSDLTFTGNGATLHFLATTNDAKVRPVDQSLSPDMRTNQRLGLKYGISMSGSRRIALTNFSVTHEVRPIKAGVIAWANKVDFATYGTVEARTKDDPPGGTNRIRLDPVYQRVVPGLKTVLSVEPATKMYNSDGTLLEASMQDVDVRYALRQNADKTTSITLFTDKFDSLPVGRRVKVHHEEIDSDVFMVSRPNASRPVTARDIVLDKINFITGPSRAGQISVERGLLITNSTFNDSSGLHTTLNAGFMITAESDVAILNSVFNDTADDVMNIKASARNVTSIDETNLIVQLDKAVDPNLTAGNSLCLYGGEFELLSCMVIQSVNDSSVTLVKSRATQSVSGAVYAVIEEAMTKRVIVRDNSVTNTDGHFRLRANLMRIANNVFQDASCNGIIVNNAVSTKGGSEAGTYREILIENNDLERVGGDFTLGAISLGTVLPDGHLSLQPNFENVTIRQNKIGSSLSPSIFAAGVSSLSIDSNSLPLGTQDFSLYLSGGFARKAGLTSVSSVQIIPPSK